MKKQQLKDKLIGFQKEIVSLTQKLNKRKRLLEEKELQDTLELISIIDSFENIFNALDTKGNNTNSDNQQAINKTSKRVIKSCRAIYRKATRILEDKGINKIEFADKKAQPGLCKIIDTQADLHQQDGSIVEIVKNGYCRDKQIIRTAEVITVLNTEKS